MGILECILLSHTINAFDYCYCAGSNIYNHKSHVNLFRTRTEQDEYVLIEMNIHVITMWFKTMNPHTVILLCYTGINYQV
jgi:hypothetical protein